MANLEEKAALIALLRTHKKEWQKITELVSRYKSAKYVLTNQLINELPEDVKIYQLKLPSSCSYPALEPIAEEILSWNREGLQFETILDDGYPQNLLSVFNRPPFVFIKGELRPEDSYSVAIVGTRRATTFGLKRTVLLARDLCKNGVTVISGLAAGIDTAALQTALDSNGRAIAVIGTGLRRVYPKENVALQKEISHLGAVISQFWPDAPPLRAHFPMRNVVMSGIALATVVIEASETSGAKMQARLTLEHGRHLFLLNSLWETYEWAKGYAKRPGVTLVSNTDDILNRLKEIVAPPKTLSLS